MILVRNDLTKDPVWSEFVDIEVHTQLHSATLVRRTGIIAMRNYIWYTIQWKNLQKKHDKVLTGRLDLVGT